LLLNLINTSTVVQALLLTEHNHGYYTFPTSKRT